MKFFKRKKNQVALFYDYVSQFLSQSKGFTCKYEDLYLKIEFSTEKSPKRAKKQEEEETQEEERKQEEEKPKKKRKKKGG